MEYRNLGRSGLKVSPLCLGSMQFGWTADEQLSHRILSAAFDAGINFIDTADVYTRWVAGNPGGVSETIIGNWIKKGSVPRDRMVVATKVRSRMGDGPNDESISRYHIMHSVEASLRRLQTDHIDLYQVHWPDSSTPLDEALRAFDDLVHQGKVRYIGASNFKAAQLVESFWVSERLMLARFDSLQPHYNLVHREEFEAELLEICRRFGVGVIPYSPLAAGFLSGKYTREARPKSARMNRVQGYFEDRNWNLLDKMSAMAAEKSASVSQLALAWLLADPVITSPIIGPRTLEQLQDNLGALSVRLAAEERKTLSDLSEWQKK
jgi:aryl-alcohol dehydrogenase-like predicted oxidoreductase